MSQTSGPSGSNEMRFACSTLVALAVAVLLATACNKHESRREPAPPLRVVSTSPSITEIMFALGAGDRLVGVTDYCTYPPEAQQIARIGSIVSPSLEAILALHPDLVVLGNLNTPFQARLESLGIPLLMFPENTTEDILHNIQMLSDRLGEPERGRQLVRQLESSIASLRHGVDDGKRRSVMFVVGRTPGTVNDIYVVGNRVFLSDLIEMAGGRNAFADLTQHYARVSKEEILARAPDIILESTHGQNLTDEKQASMRQAWAALGYLPAVRNHRIYFLNDDYLLIPGPRFVQTLKKLTTILQQENPDG